MAGQDSWTLPPAQNPDSFISLQNVEPVLRGILQRRRGYSLFSATFGFVFPRSYAFRSESLGLRRIVWTSASNVFATDEAGSHLFGSTPIFTPSVNATVAPRMVLSRDYGYFSDGAVGDYRKWNGTNTAGNLTNWGIDVTNSTGGGGNSTKVPTAAANDAAGTVAWTNTAGVLGNTTDAVQTLTQNQTADHLLATNFGFAVGATATITKIIVSGTGFVSSTGGFFPSIGVTLLKNSVLTGSTNSLIGSVSIPLNSDGSWTTSFVPSSWGYNWQVADVNATGFGVSFIGNSFAIVDTETFNLRNVSITVQFSFTSGGGGGSITIGAPGVGAINLFNGRTYFYAFLNSRTGHVSGLSAPSLSTGPLTSNNVPLSNIATSNDTQVDTTIVLATADGNDQTTLYQLTLLTNGTTTFTDNVTDATLVTQPLYLNTDLAGVIHGIANNNPPPLLDFPTKHKGRLYGAVGRALYFSKNLDEVTTAGGLITSKWEEAWPAVNQFDISDQVETIRALLSDGETLWIGTERSVRRLIGDSPSNFQKPEVQFNEVGVFSQEVWKVVFVEGQPVGTIWLTPDLRVVGSDFNTYLDIGTPIQDVLSTINATAAGATIFAAYVNSGPADYYMLYIPTGSNTVADTICVYNLRSKKWFIWKPTDLCSTALFNVSQNGTPQWLFSTLAGPMYNWDITQTLVQDRINNGPVNFVASLQTSWLDLGDYTLRKFVNQIIPTTADQTALTIQVDAASNELDFNTPLSVVPATTVTPAAIPTDVFVPLASGPSHSRAFRFTFTSPASTVQNILTGFSIEAGGFHKY